MPSGSQVRASGHRRFWPGRYFHFYLTFLLHNYQIAKRVRPAPVNSLAALAVHLIREFALLGGAHAVAASEMLYCSAQTRANAPIAARS